MKYQSNIRRSGILVGSETFAEDVLTTLANAAAVAWTRSFCIEDSGAVTRLANLLVQSLLSPLARAPEPLDLGAALDIAAEDRIRSWFAHVYGVESVDHLPGFAKLRLAFITVNAAGRWSGVFLDGERPCHDLHRALEAAMVRATPPPRPSAMPRQVL